MTVQSKQYASNIHLQLQIYVYYIDQNNAIREVSIKYTQTVSKDGEAESKFKHEFKPMNHSGPIADAAQSRGLLYAIANSKVPGTVRVGFNPSFNPTLITEVVLEPQQDSSGQQPWFTVCCANSSTIQLNNGDTRIYYQGTDGHLYERLLDSSRFESDRDVLGSRELPCNSRIVATTWGNNFKHVSNFQTVHCSAYLNLLNYRSVSISLTERVASARLAVITGWGLCSAKDL